MDVSKPLPKEINFQRNDKEFTVTFQFPWLPSRCKTYDKWGHLAEVCRLQKKTTSPTIDKEEEKEQEQLQSQEPIKVDELVQEQTDDRVEEGQIIEVETHKVLQTVENGVNEGNDEQGTGPWFLR